MPKSCFDGPLTEECKDCMYWSNGDKEWKNHTIITVPMGEGYIGCGANFPIDECEAFHKMWEEEQKEAE